MGGEGWVLVGIGWYCWVLVVTGGYWLVLLGIGGHWWVWVGIAGYWRGLAGMYMLHQEHQTPQLLSTIVLDWW